MGRLAGAAALVGAALLLTVPVAAQPAAPAKAALCVTCHGEQGNSRDAAIPVLAGQPMLYSFLRLRQLQGQIDHPVMSPIARALTDADIESLSTYFSTLKPLPRLAAFDSERAARGQAIASRLGCAQCHRTDYLGGDQMPRLAGQQVRYLVEQMGLIRQNKRSDDNGNMVDTLNRISPDQVEDLAHFLASLH